MMLLLLVVVDDVVVLVVVDDVVVLVVVDDDLERTTAAYPPAAIRIITTTTIAIMAILAMACFSLEVRLENKMFSFLGVYSSLKAFFSSGGIFLQSSIIFQIGCKKQLHLLLTH